MKLTLEVNEVRPGSYVPKKGGDPINTLDLICIDKSEGRRLSHSVVFAVGRDQKESLMGVNLRDKKLEVDVTEVKLSVQGEIQFRGIVGNLEALTAGSGGKLPVEKPAAKAA